MLDRLFRLLTEYPGVHIEVRGHTSGGPPGGSIDLIYSDHLSLERAKKVASQLVSRGIDPERIRYKGYGPRLPISDNLTDEGRKKNRRVDIKIVKI